MPTLTIHVSDEVADSLGRQARALLLGRRAYIRAVLAAVAEEASRANPARGRGEADDAR